jgi:4-amino-4-deoxy-L-arabinose transferase-like glycosyltransferase
LGLRPVMVVFAAANCLLVVAIARRLTGRLAALVAGVLYALDPFIVRFDSRVMLEAPTMTATLLGLAAALVGVERTGRTRLVWLGAAGIAFGVAITTKSTSALVTTLPLLLMCATSSGPRRREAAGMVVVQCTVYACYVGWVASTGHLGDWFGQTLHGVVRATGKPQTGFNAVGAPTVTDRALANLTQFGPSYLLIGVAVASILVLLFEDMRERGRTGRHALLGGDTIVRMLTCWLGGVVLAIGYTFAFGELEEQTFYLMAVPSTIVIAVLAARTHGRTGRIVVALGVVAVLAWSAQVWTAVHNGRDDAYRRLVEHLAPMRDRGTVIALGEYTAQFVLPGFGLVPLGTSGSAPGARYALVSTQLADLRLAPVSSATIAEMNRRYRVVFTAHGRTSGDLRLYDLRASR